MLNTRGQLAAAQSWTAKWRQKQPDNSVMILESVRQDIVAGRTEEALTKSDQYIIEQVELAKKGPASGAEDEKAKQARIKAVRELAQVAVAQTWQNAGKPAEAEQWVNECLKEDPKYMDARLLRTFIAIDRKDWQTVRDVNEDILKDDKNNQVAKSNLAWVLAVHFDQPAEGLKIVRSMLVGPFSGKEIPVESLTADFLNIVGEVYEQALRKKVEQDLQPKMLQIFDLASKRYQSDPRMFLYFRRGLRPGRQGTSQRGFSDGAATGEGGQGPAFGGAAKEFIQKVGERMSGP